MNKQQFLDALREALRGYPSDEVERSLSFYSEMIDDRVEAGKTETEAVASLGSVDEVVRKIREEMPMSAIVKDRMRSSYNRQKEKTGGSAVPWIILAVVLCPFWIPLVFACFGIMIGFLGAAFGIVVGFWGTFLGLAIGAIGSLIAAGAMLVTGGGAGAALIFVGSAFVCAALAIAFFWAAFWIGKAIVLAIRALYRAIKHSLSKK